MQDWLLTSFSTLLMTIISVVIIFSVVILITRISGLRTFAKMSSFDFASTIAIGSILASVILNQNQSLLKGSLALAGIIVFQFIFSLCKRKFKWFNRLATNQPMMLMRDGEFVDKNLNKTNVSRSDIYAKLREANVKNLKEVLAVVMESTGDISVIHKSLNVDFQEELLLGVKEE